MFWILNKRFSVSCACALLSACALSEPSPPDGGQQLSPLTVKQVQQNPQLLQPPPMVRWGGTIVSLDNQADGSTQLEIVSRRLHSGGRPVHEDRSDGRFKAKLQAFLDPEIVKAGRDITVVGIVTGIESGLVGQSEYDYPVLDVTAEKYRYWQKNTVVVQRHFRHWHQYPFHRGRDPFYDGWLYPRYRKRRY